MKKSNLEKVLVVAVVLGLLVVVLGQDLYAQTASTGGIEKAAEAVKSSSVKVKEAVTIACGALATVCGGIGLVGALNKSTNEEQNASKMYIKWFTAAGLFALAWSLMATFFG